MKLAIKALSRAILLPLFCTATLMAQAETVPLAVKADAPKTYVVVKGDTLWDISALYLDSPWLWPRLWQINPEIENPHLIYPGDKLSLVWKNGQPMLSLKPVVTLSPKARITEKKALPVVAESLVLPYLQSDRLLEKEKLATVARVMGTSEGHQYLAKEESLFISGQHSEKQWAIYRVVAEFTRDDLPSPVVALRVVAEGKLRHSAEDYSSLEVTALRQEVLLNDIALPVSETQLNTLSTTFYPSPAPQGLAVKMLGNIDGIDYSAPNQVVILDKGSADNLRQGHMFELYNTSAEVYRRDDAFSYESGSADEAITLPQTRVGELMVIRPYDYFSLALITRSNKPITRDIIVVPPSEPEPSPSTQEP